MTRARPQAAAKPAKAVVADEVDDSVAAELVSLEEADEEAADSGAVKVPGEEDIEGDDDDDTFLAEEEEEDEEDVGDIIGDVEEEER